MAEERKKPTRRKRSSRTESRAAKPAKDANGSRSGGFLQSGPLAGKLSQNKAKASAKPTRTAAKSDAAAGAHRLFARKEDAPAAPSQPGRRRSLKAGTKEKATRMGHAALHRKQGETAGQKAVQQQAAPQVQPPVQQQAASQPAPAPQPQAQVQPVPQVAPQPQAAPQRQVAPQPQGKRAPAPAQASEQLTSQEAHAQAVAAARQQAAASAVELQIPSLSPNFDPDAMESLPAATQSAEAVAIPAVEATEDAVAEAPQAAPAAGEVPVDGVPAADVAAAPAVTPEEAAAEAAEEADAAAADFDPAEQRPSVAGKRVANPEIIDHVAETARRKARLRKIASALGIILILVAVVVALFAWQRWFRYDDAADIQGTWMLNANDKQQVVIDDSSIDLVKGVAYKYTLDPQSKTISFAFSDKSGTASYHFNGDRTVLVLTEGDNQPNLLVQLGLIDDPAIANDSLDDNVTVLTKKSDSTNAKNAGKKNKKKSSDASTSESASDSASASESTASDEGQDVSSSSESAGESSSSNG